MRSKANRRSKTARSAGHQRPPHSPPFTGRALLLHLAVAAADGRGDKTGTHGGGPEKNLSASTSPAARAKRRPRRRFVRRLTPTCVSSAAAMRARGTPKAPEAVARAQVAHVLRGCASRATTTSASANRLAAPSRGSAGAAAAARRGRPRSRAPAGAAGDDAGAASAHRGAVAVGAKRGPRSARARIDRARRRRRGLEDGVSTSTSISGRREGPPLLRTTWRPPGSPLDLGRSKHSSESEEGDAVRAAQACCGALHESLPAARASSSLRSRREKPSAALSLPPARTSATARATASGTRAAFAASRAPASALVSFSS